MKFECRGRSLSVGRFKAVAACLGFCRCRLQLPAGAAGLERWLELVYMQKSVATGSLANEWK